MNRIAVSEAYLFFVPCFLKGYDRPTPIGNTTRSFPDACRAEEEAYLNATNSSIYSTWSLENGWFADEL